ncbi:MAG: adenine deaminase [Christensenellaceae bacterium]|nr:adenine deaminase [Christensenellaceae bacterium]
MAYDAKTLVRELEAASGKIPVDLIFENLRLVDVYTGEVRKTNLAMFGGKIVGVGVAKDTECAERVDCGGRYAVPGFLDAHVHIETTLLTPEALGQVIVPWGTTTLFVDAMEIANVAGNEGLLALVKDAHNLPFRIFLEIPSRVPTAPGLETAGAELGVTEVEQLLTLPESVSLGELDPSKILDIREEYLQKVCVALNLGKICNGHAIGLSADALNIYATGHLHDDHESVTYEELLERLRVGLKALVREGSSERNVLALIKGVVENGLPTENILFCTDDKHVQDIHKEGHISYNIQQAINCGLDPVKAIQIATVNAAKHFRLDHMIGSLTPGRQADIVLLDDLKTIRPAAVYKDGKCVAENGSALPTEQKSYPDKLFNTVHLPAGLSKESFAIYTQGKEAKCRVISLIQDQIINEEKQLWMPIANGEISASVPRDILKLSVVERHGKNGHISTALVMGFGLQKGALASSVSHDHHNIVVMGGNDADMLLAVQELGRIHGGFAAACDGRILGSVALPLAGLMSLENADEVMRRMDVLNEEVEKLGCPMASPFMSLSFISLPTVPQLGLTDYGLIDVLGHKITNLVLETKA